jgi:hypothetical protein
MHHKLQKAYAGVLVAIFVALLGVGGWISSASGIPIRDPDIIYCEKNEFLRNATGRNISWGNTTFSERVEYANSATALCFMVTPILLITYYFDRLNGIVFVYGIYQVVHAVGTATNHACSCQPGLSWDNASIWSLQAFIISINIFAALPLLKKKASTLCNQYFLIAIANAIATLLFTGIALVPSSDATQSAIQGVLFVLLVAASAYITAKKRITKLGRAGFIASVVLLIIGVIPAILDKLVCQTPLFGLHALWHIIGGAVAMPIYTVYFMEMLKWADSNRKYEHDEHDEHGKRVPDYFAATWPDDCVADDDVPNV